MRVTIVKILLGFRQLSLTFKCSTNQQAFVPIKADISWEWCPQPVCTRFLALILTSIQKFKQKSYTHFGKPVSKVQIHLWNMKTK